MRKIIKQPGILALLALIFIIAACDMGMIGKPSVSRDTVDIGLSGPGTGEQPSGGVTSYTVTFDRNGGDTEADPKTKTVTSPATTVVILPHHPTRTGDYYFKNWTTNPDGSGTEFTAITPVTADITVYAQWTHTPTYTVTFNKNGGDTEASPPNMTVTSPATAVVTLPAAPTRTGYSFTGWNTKAGDDGTLFTAATTVTADIEVFAQWTVNILSITYASGGGTGSAPTSPTSAAYGTNVTMPVNPYTYSGKNFTGWAVSGTGSTTGTHNAGASVAVSALSTAIAAGNASITLTATWADAPVTTLSSNANIRAVSGSGATALYGLYVGGMPGIDNGTPRSTADGFSNATAIALSGNNATDKPANNVVVIVEDNKVSKVEFGVNATASSTNVPSNTAPSTWYTLSKSNEFTTPDTVDKRWAGPLTVAAITSSSGRGFYVRITAEDGTTQVYRYWQYVSTTVSNNVTRGELTALSIGGVAVITGGNVQGSHSKGIAQGWWNKTVAPDLVPGEVTITAAQAASCAVSATVNNGDSSTLSLAKISASQWPLLENSTLTFTTTGSAGNHASVSGTFTNVTDGDYIVIRQNASTAANYKALINHYVIKVNVK
jgi:uncharacterized repeat protein (TIGR02543 family)